MAKKTTKAKPIRLTPDQEAQIKAAIERVKAGKAANWPTGFRY